MNWVLGSCTSGVEEIRPSETRQHLHRFVLLFHTFQVRTHVNTKFYEVRNALSIRVIQNDPDSSLPKVCQTSVCGSYPELPLESLHVNQRHTERLCESSS